MPRNPNDHDDRVVNGLSVDRDRRIEDILRRGRTMDRREELAQMRAGQTEERIKEIFDNISGRAEADVYASAARETQLKERYVNQKDMYESIRVSRTNERITSEIMSQMGAGGQASYINSMARSSSVNGIAIDAARRIPQSELEAHRNRFMNKAGESFNQALTYADVMAPHGDIDDDRLNSLHSTRAQQMGHLNEVAYADAALRKQRQLGLDVESRYGAALRSGNRVERDLMAHGIAQDIAAGKAPNASEARGQEVNLLKQFSEQMRQINEATEKTGPAFEKLLGDLEKTGGELEKVRELQKQLRESGGGTGSRGAGQMLMVGMGLQMASGLVGEIGLNQSNRQTENRIAAANEVNQLWGQRGSALRGDMSSLYMMTDGALGEQDAAGQFNKRLMQTAQGLSLGGDLFTAGAYGIAAGAGIATPGGRALSALSGSGMSNVANAANSLSSATTTGFDMVRGISANAEALDEKARQRRLYYERNMITNQMREVAYGHTMGARGAALAIGGAAGTGFFDEAIGSENLSRMVSARMSPEQFNALAAEGASQGSVFSANSVYASRNLEIAGYGTASQNMQRQNIIAAGGANNPSASLASVLEVAFSKGLSTNAALNIIAQSTSQMAQSSAGFGRGLDVSSAGATVIGRLINESNPNQEVAAQRAATAAGRINDIVTDTSANFGSMVGIHSIAHRAGVSFSAAERFQSTDVTTRQAIQDEMDRIGGLKGGDKATAEKNLGKEMYEIGLGGFVDPKTGTIDRQKITAAMEVGRGQLMREANFTARVTDQNLPGYKQYLETGVIPEGSEYHELRTAAGEVSSRQGISLSEGNAFKQGTNPRTTTGILKARGAVGSGVGPTSAGQRDADTLATASGADLANQAKLVAESTGNMVAAIRDWTERTEKLVGSLNQDSAETFRRAATQASKDFVSGATIFKTSVDKFANSVGNRGARASTNSPSQKH